MRVIAVYNLKGGVGKTTAAVNLAHVAARGGARVLLWDLDAQGAAGFTLGVEPLGRGSARKVAKGKDDLAGQIQESRFERLDVLAADFSYRHFDKLLAEEGRGKRLKKLLSALADDYDYVLLDCPPSLSDLSEQVFAAARALVIPLLPTTLSTRTYGQLIDHLMAKLREPPVLMPFFSMVDSRKALHRETVATFPAHHPEMLPTLIPYASNVERMALEQRPVTAASPHSRAGVAFASLWQDVLDRL